MDEGPAIRPVLRSVPGWCATVGLIAIAVLRCVVAWSPQLYWMSAPGARQTPLTELGPAAAAITDALAAGVLALALVDALLHRRPTRWALIGFWAVGAGFALYHGALNADSLRIGGHWIGALALGLAAAHLAGDRAQRRVLIAAAVALLLPLAAQAVYQVTVEHSLTVANYEQNKQRILEARGWEPGSPEQRQFERRLRQVEATGRFGFSNVLGTVALSLSLIALGAAVSLLRSHWRRLAPWAAALVAAVGLGVVALTFSKGAVLALLIAAGATGVACWCAHRWRLGAWWWRLAAFGAVAAAIVGVIGRGALGPPETAEGERSLLFRYHYWQAAARMIGERPLLGVGPGSFQQEYLRHKNPLNPEQVKDPHNVFAAYISTLGVGGMCFSLVLLGLLWRAAGPVAHLSGRDPPAAAGHGGSPGTAGGGCATEPDQKRWRWSLVLAGAVIAFGAQYAVELPRYWLGPAVLWLGSAVGFVALGGWLSGRRELDGRCARLGLFAAAVGLMLHGQVEMSLTNTMAAPLLAALVGLAAADPDAPRQTKLCAGGISAAALAGAVAVVMVRLHVSPLVVQQHHLRHAAAAQRAGRTDRAVAHLLRASSDPPDADAATDAARIGVRASIGNALSRAPSDPAWYLDRLRAQRRDGLAPAKLAIAEARLGQYLWRRTEDRRWLQRALEAARDAVRYDRYGIEAHALAAELADAAGRTEQAARFAQRALTLSERAYLDPAAQLTGDKRRRMRQLASAGGSAAKEKE